MNLFLIYLSDCDGTSVIRVTDSESAAKRYCDAQNKCAELEDNAFENTYYYVQQKLYTGGDMSSIAACIERCNDRKESEQCLNDNEDYFVRLYSCTSSYD